MIAENRARKAILDTGKSSVTTMAGTGVLEKPLRPEFHEVVEGKRFITQLLQPD